MVVVRILVWVTVGLLSGSRDARATSLTDLSATARDSVAHLSVRDPRGTEVSFGSGFVISRSGRLVTNFHVIAGAVHIVAVFPNRREAEVTGVWIADKELDLAILQLQPGPYEPLSLATEPVRVGEDIVVIGSPLGLGNSVSTGIVSAVRENGLEETSYRRAAANWGLQFTAAAAPGSSGSPILRSNGEVVGVLVGHLGGLDGAHFGILVSKVQQLLGAAPQKPGPLLSATGARSLRTNLLISSGVLAGLATLWLVSSKALQSFARRRPPRAR